jgi:hypothetical protein
MTKKLNGVQHGRETRPFPPYLYSAIASVVPFQGYFIVGKEIREVTK